MNYCSNCGKSLKKSDKYCGGCGNETSRAKNSENKKPTKKLKVSSKHREEVQKLEKNLKNAGDTGVALGWLQMFVVILLFVFGDHIGKLAIFQFGLTDVALYIPFATMVIILSKRIRILKSARIIKYIYILLISSSLMLFLSLIGGGRVGFLWIFYIYYLFKALKSASKLKQITGYFSEENVHLRFKTFHWILLGVVTVIFIFIGLAFDSIGEGFAPEYKAEFMSSCLEEAGGISYNDYCICAYDYLVENYTYIEATTLSNFDEIVKACSPHIPK